MPLSLIPLSLWIWEPLEQTAYLHSNNPGHNALLSSPDSSFVLCLIITSEATERRVGGWRAALSTLQRFNRGEAD